MKIITTKGFQIEYDLETDKDYQRGRKLLEFLTQTENYNANETDDEAITSITKTIDTINVWDKELIHSVASHYYHQLKTKYGNEEIDYVAFLYLQGKLVIEELEGKFE